MASKFGLFQPNIEFDPNVFEVALVGCIFLWIRISVWSDLNFDLISVKIRVSRSEFIFFSRGFPTSKQQIDWMVYLQLKIRRIFQNSNTSVVRNLVTMLYNVLMRKKHENIMHQQSLLIHYRRRQDLTRLRTSLRKNIPFSLFSRALLQIIVILGSQIVVIPNI